MVSPRVRLVRAPNPSAMTVTGTNTYLIDCEDGTAICIDPGPPMPAHLDAIAQHAQQMHCSITLICLTHAHPDHAPGAPLLAQLTGAPVAAHHACEFPHTRDLRDGEVLAQGKARLTVVESPGHTFDHCSFYEARERALFTGDTVIGEGYVVIAPPSGDMRAYQRSLARMLKDYGDAQVIYGGHGEPVGTPRQKLNDYIDHRHKRERELLAALGSGPQTIPKLVAHIYRDTPRILWPAAARQMLAYLIALEREGRVRSHDAGRAMSSEEHAILNPEWQSIVGAEHAATVEAELGSMLRLDAVRMYQLT